MDEKLKLGFGSFNGGNHTRTGRADHIDSINILNPKYSGPQNDVDFGLTFESQPSLSSYH